MTTTAQPNTFVILDGGDYPIPVRVHAFDDNGLPLVLGRQGLVNVDQLAAAVFSLESPHYRLTEILGDEGIEALEQSA